uniref:PHD-type zinc finger plants domain-containing protein n=1 Tax=Aegilops tauschii subsp. strangulata TaxID=200361 RepID=A0A453IZ23_AEGTS
MGSDGKLGSGSAAVCCMCGDHGLLPELFRCDACSVRSQHTCTARIGTPRRRRTAHATGA